MQAVIEKEKINIENMIYEIRGKQVMLDSDLAILYQCKNGTKEINQAVKNNPLKFPERFSWVLNNSELDELRSKILTTNYSKMSRSNPHVFTEQGIAMLATILKTSVATEVSISIMDAFVSMRKYISNNLLEQKYINNIVLEDRERINLIEKTLNQFKEKSSHIFFEGQIYDAYSLLIDIFNKCQKEIIIIDNYIDKKILDILSKINKEIIIYTNQYNNNDYLKYQKQYANITLNITDKFHDRFIIIDKEILYHSGASFKDLGNKCFAINKIDNNDILNELLNVL